MSKTMNKYLELKAEYELLVEICPPLFQIKYQLETLERNPIYSEQLAKGILFESTQYLKKLEKRIDETENEMQVVALALLKKDHCISVGEKIPYHHPGTGKSGYIRVEKVNIYFKPDWDEDTYCVSGPRFRKDGKIGKTDTSAFLKVLSIG